MKTFRPDPFMLKWGVPEAGYEWQKGSDSEPHLVSRAEIGSLVWIKEPLQNSGLFIEFANLKPTQDAIKQFANTWGDIFSKYGPLDLMPQQKGSLSLIMGASFEKWKDAIGEMRVLVRLWEAVKDPKHKRADLAKVITWAHGGVRYTIPFPHGAAHCWLAHPEIDRELLARFSPGDVLWPAKYALQAEINKRLANPEISCVPRLIWTAERNQRIIFTPMNLLGAMWLQFAQAVTEEFQLRVCEGCGKYFQIGPGGKRRADATTCGPACRQRKRRKKLLQ